MSPNKMPKLIDVKMQNGKLALVLVRQNLMPKSKQKDKMQKTVQEKV
jgi:hypothetical protein